MAEAGAGTAGSGDAGAAGTAGAAGAAGAAAGAGAAAAPWHGQTEQTAVDYVTNKGWTGIGDVIKSYQGAEKLIGRDPNTLLQIPRADDPAGFRSVMAKLGLPETPDKYEIAAPPEGLKPDEGYIKWARDAFHKSGLTAAQVKELTGAHNNYVAETLKAQATDYQTKVVSEKAALLKEWGGGHERMLASAKSAATTLGFTGDMIDAMEQAVGYAGTYKFFANLGQKMGEDGFVSAGDKSGGGFNGAPTPAEAKAQWEAMKVDTTTVAALRDPQHPGHKAAKEKQTTLFKIMYPEG